MKKKKTIKKTAKKGKAKTKTSRGNKRREKKGVLTWYLPFLLAFLLCLSFLVFLYFLMSTNYRGWEEEFAESGPSVVYFQESNIDLEKKVLEYNRSDREYSFIEFTREESLFLFSNALQESLPDWFEIEKTALETSRGSWSFYVKGKIKNYSLPWFEILLVKDNVQSVDIYIEDIFVGNFSLKNVNNSVVEKANNGLSRAVRLINDGNFAGRIFENIELGEDSLVIKSRNISL